MVTRGQLGSGSDLARLGSGSDLARIWLGSGSDLAWIWLGSGSDQLGRARHEASHLEEEPVLMRLRHACKLLDRAPLWTIEPLYLRQSAHVHTRLG